MKQCVGGKSLRLENEAIHPLIFLFFSFYYYFHLYIVLKNWKLAENAIPIWTFEVWKLNCERLITLHNFSQKFLRVIDIIISHAQFFRNYEINNAKKAKKHGQEITLLDEF